MDARHADLRAILRARAGEAAVCDDLQQVHLEALAGHVIVRGHLLGGLQRALGLAQLDIDSFRLGINAVHDGGQDLVFLLDEVVVDLAALGLADLLHDHLLGGLRSHAAEVVRRDLDLNDVVLLIAGLNPARILDGDFASLVDYPLHDGLARKQAHRAGHAVKLHAHIRVGGRHAVLLVEVILIGALERFLNRGEQHLLADALLLGQKRNRLNHFLIFILVHHLAHPLPRRTPPPHVPLHRQARRSGRPP